YRGVRPRRGAAHTRTPSLEARPEVSRSGRSGPVHDTVTARRTLSAKDEPMGGRGPPQMRRPLRPIPAVAYRLTGRLHPTARSGAGRIVPSAQPRRPAGRQRTGRLRHLPATGPDRATVLGLTHSSGAPEPTARRRSRLPDHRYLAGLS